MAVVKGLMHLPWVGAGADADAKADWSSYTQLW